LYEESGEMAYLNELYFSLIELSVWAKIFRTPKNLLAPTLKHQFIAKWFLSHKSNDWNDCACGACCRVAL